MGRVGDLGVWAGMLGKRRMGLDSLGLGRIIGGKM